jgi:hypothetical protein
MAKKEQKPYTTMALKKQQVVLRLSEPVESQLWLLPTLTHVVMLG